MLSKTFFPGVAFITGAGGTGMRILEPEQRDLSDIYPY